MNLYNLITRLSKNEQLNLLPSWQKAYFSSDTFLINHEMITNYIYSARDALFSDKSCFSRIIEILDNEEFRELNDSLFPRARKRTCHEIMNLLSRKDDKYNLTRRLKLFFEVSQKKAEELDDSKRAVDFQGQSVRFFELLDYQMYIKEQLMSFLEDNILLGRVLVHMPTGTGKTKTTMHLITQYFQNNLEKKGLILWIAHTNVLLEQAQDTLNSVWYHHGENILPIYRVYGGLTYDLEKMNDVGGVAFCNISSLIDLYSSSKTKYVELRKNVNLVVFDEAHKCLAKETSNVLEDIMRIRNGNSNRCLIGLTATPGRSVENSEENQRLVDFFEKRIVTIDSKIIERFSKSEYFFENNYDDSRIIKYFQDRHILAKLKREIIDYQQDSDYLDELIKNKQKKNTSQEYSKDVIELVSTNVERNKAILKRLLELNEERIATIFFACSVEHGKFISTMLRIRGVNTCEVYGETNSLQRTKEIESFRNGYSNILINCSVLTTGFDSTNIRCVFISRPTKSVVLYSQMIGRGLRGVKMGGNDECILVDLHDNLSRFSDEDEAFSCFEDYWR